MEKRKTTKAAPSAKTIYDFGALKPGGPGAIYTVDKVKDPELQAYLVNRIRTAATVYGRRNGCKFTTQRTAPNELTVWRVA